MMTKKSNKERQRCSTTEAVESAALSLKSVDDVKGCDGLSLSMLCVGDGVTNDVLKEATKDVPSPVP